MPPDVAAGPSVQVDRADLRKKLAAHFDKEELRTLCFDLGIDDNNLPDTLDGMARELIKYCERNQRIPELITECERLHPKVSWAASPAAAPEQFPAGTLYGIIRDPDVMGFLGGLPAMVRQKVDDAIVKLQFNPRPEGNESRVVNGMPLTKVTVQMEQPPNYLLVYTVNEQKENIYLITVSEKRFS
jgi:hypothetical protein